jgi:hypothetical protein
MLNSDDEQDNANKKIANNQCSLPSDDFTQKESLGIKTGVTPTQTTGNKLQDDYMRLCQMSVAGNASSGPMKGGAAKQPQMVGGKATGNVTAHNNKP